MDQSITQWINDLAGGNAGLDHFMIAASQWGIPLIVLCVVLQWWSRRDRMSVRHACAAAGLSFLLGLGFNQVILLFLHRVRPYDAGLTHLLIARSADWSFPSDHATAGFAIAAAFLLHRFWGRGAALLAGALLIAVSRVYVGTHYASDVLGGAATGIAAAALVRLLYRADTWADRLITRIL